MLRKHGDKARQRVAAGFWEHRCADITFGARVSSGMIGVPAGTRIEGGNATADSSCISCASPANPAVAVGCAATSWCVPAPTRGADEFWGLRDVVASSLWAAESSIATTRTTRVPRPCERSTRALRHSRPAVLVLSMAKLAPITILPEPIGSILRLAELIERGGCSA
jgi:hypothetical protein